jgi:type IV pilus assembly protein PilC
MASHPYCFDTVFVALVRAGEQSGQLTQVLDELAENLKWQDEIAAQARRALTYPIIVLVVIVAVVFVLMTFLVPQLAATFKTLVPKLPRETEVLVVISGVFVRWWYLLLGIPAAIGFGAWTLAQTNDGVQRRLDEMSFRLPVLGPIRQKIILARFSTIFAMLYKSGISVLECIQICEKVVASRVMEEGCSASAAASPRARASRRRSSPRSSSRRSCCGCCAWANPRAASTRRSST